jgi:hypothetical protein
MYGRRRLEVKLAARNVRFRSKADIQRRLSDVRFTPESGHGVQSGLDQFLQFSAVAGSHDCAKPDPHSGTRVGLPLLVSGLCPEGAFSAVPSYRTRCRNFVSCGGRHSGRWLRVFVLTKLLGDIRRDPLPYYAASSISSQPVKASRNLLRRSATLSAVIGSGWDCSRALNASSITRNRS